MTDRIRALQREADRLAGEARTLLGDVRKLEIERDLKAEQAKQAAAEAAGAQDSLRQTTDRLASLELQRLSQLPDLKQQLVDIYKRGRSGYARLLFGARDLREFARATRAMASLAPSTRSASTTIAGRSRRCARSERRSRSERASCRHATPRPARPARADRAVAARAARMAEIDSRRDLTAQYVGELQVAYDKIQQQLNATEGRGDAVNVPLLPFRGALEWPATGRIGSRFGQPKAGWVEAPSETASKSPRRKTFRSGPSTVERSATPTPLPVWARWSSSTTAAITTPSTATWGRSASKRERPWKPVRDRPRRRVAGWTARALLRAPDRR